MMDFGVPPVPDEELDERLAHMDRLGSRPYAEIGVPMFLVAEDLTAGASADARPGRADDGTGRVLAMLLAEGAEAMRRRLPELTPKDLARLVESLADRYFLGLATPAFSQSQDLHPRAGNR
jgi:hypothetical protein